MSSESLWRAALLAGSEGVSHLVSALKEGGSVVVAGSPAAVASLVAAANEDLAAPGKRILHLDLEGWESDQEDLNAFARFQAAVGGAGRPPETAATLAAGHGVFQACWISFLHSLEKPRPAVLPPVIDRRAFVERLTSWAGEEPLVIVTADGDAVPRPVHQALRETSARTRVTWIDGTRGRDAAVKARPLFEAPVIADIDRRLDSATDGFRGALEQPARRALEALMLIEAPIPLALLLPFIARPGSLDEEEAEAFIDGVDDHLADQLGLLEDLGFLHPAFEQSVYRSADPAAASRLRHRLADELPRRAAELLEFLRPLLPPHRRATTSLLSRLGDLAHGVGDPRSRHLRRRLAWWTEAAELPAAVRQDAAGGELTDHDLVFLARDAVLPPAARQVFIEAREELGVPAAEQGAHLLLRAQVLGQLGNQPEALDAASKSLEWNALNHGRRSEPFLASQVACARLMAAAGELTAARDELIRARRLAEEALGEHDPRLIGLATDLGEVYTEIGELRSAKAPLSEAVRLARRIHGEGHPSTLARRNNLAALLIDIGELEAAREQLQLALKAAGPEAPDPRLRAGLLHNLQSVFLRLGISDPKELEDLLERSVALLGENPGQIPLLAQLGDVLRQAGERAEAAAYFGRALELAEKHLPPDHPTFLRLLDSLRDLAVLPGSGTP